MRLSFGHTLWRLQPTLDQRAQRFLPEHVRHLFRIIDVEPKVVLLFHRENDGKIQLLAWPERVLHRGQTVLARK